MERTASSSAKNHLVMSVRLGAKFGIWHWGMFYGRVTDFMEIDSPVLQKDSNFKIEKYSSTLQLNKSHSAFLRLLKV